MWWQAFNNHWHIANNENKCLIVCNSQRHLRWKDVELSWHAIGWTGCYGNLETAISNFPFPPNKSHTKRLIDIYTVPCIHTYIYEYSSFLCEVMISSTSKQWADIGHLNVTKHHALCSRSNELRKEATSLRRPQVPTCIFWFKTNPFDVCAERILS